MQLTQEGSFLVLETEHLKTVLNCLTFANDQNSQLLLEQTTVSVLGVVEAGTQETGSNRGKALDRQGGIQTSPLSSKESYLWSLAVGLGTSLCQT